MGSLIALLKRGDRGIAAVETVIALGAMAAILVLVAVQVLLRQFQADTLKPVGLDDYSWMTPVARFLLLWSTLTGASLATRSRRHILIDVVTKSLPKRAATGVNVAAALVAAALCATIAGIAAYVVEANWTQQTVLRGINLGPVQIIIPISFGIMMFRFLVVLLEDLRGVATGDLAYLKLYEAHPAQEIEAAHGQPISSDAQLLGEAPRDGVSDTQAPGTGEPREGAAGGGAAGGSAGGEGGGRS